MNPKTLTRNLGDDGALPLGVGALGFVLLVISLVSLFFQDLNNYAWLTFLVLIVVGGLAIPRRAGSAMNPLPIPVAALTVLVFPWGSPGAIVMVAILSTFLALRVRGSIKNDPYSTLVVPAMSGISAGFVWFLTWAAAHLAGHTPHVNLALGALDHECTQAWVNERTEYVFVYAALLTLWAPLDAVIGAWIKEKSKVGRLNTAVKNPLLEHTVLTGITTAAAVIISLFGFYRNVLEEVIPVAVPVVILLLVSLRGLPGTAGSARAVKAQQVKAVSAISENLGRAVSRGQIKEIVKRDMPEVVSAWAVRWVAPEEGEPSARRGEIVKPLEGFGKNLGWLVSKGLDPYTDHDLDELVELQVCKAVAELLRSEAEAAARAEAEERAAYLAERVDEEHKLFAAAQHEVGNPLAVIDGYLGLLRMDILDEAEKTEAVAAMQLASKRIRLVSQSLLTLAAAERGQVLPSLEPVTVDQLVTPMSVEYTYMFEDSNITVESSNAEETVCVDVMWVRQVVDNLVSNASKATREGGQVWVWVGAEGDDLKITVKDTGVGIPAEDLGTVQEAFKRASSKNNRKVPGVGLGLYIVTGLIQLHGGTLEISSGENTGTTVTAVFTDVKKGC